MLGWFTDKSTYRQWVWLCAPSYEHKTIWRLEKWGKGAVKFTVLLMWQILDVILWFNISLIWPAWTKTTHPLQPGNLLWMMKRNPLEKKKSRTKVQLTGKKVIAIPPNTVILNSTKISPGIYSHALPLGQQFPGMHNWRKRYTTKLGLIYNPSWSIFLSTSLN